MGDDIEIKRMKFKVYVRCRPAAAENLNGIVKPEHRILYLTDPTKGHTSEFVFDRVFGSEATQDVVFDEVGRPLIEHVLQGYNACCFAYGQTGSGKTYTMFGKETGEWDMRGIIPRTAQLLFKSAAEVQQTNPVRFTFFVSFLEIYLEQVRDLGYAVQGLKRASGTNIATDKTNLEIWEDPSGMTLVKDLTYVEVSKVEDVMSILKAGYALRQTASTAQNDVSSRSHTVFTISVVQYRDGHQPVTGRLNLVDLAGSERLNKSHSEGQRLNETKAINKSLTALGKVVMTLAQEGDKPHVPFRDSKLTRILKDSLQGNSFTSLMATLNPLPDNAEECSNTLQFAVRCQSINTAPHVNVLTAGGAQDAALERLMQQVAQLQEELEFTHAHYQKMIEAVAGPGWSQDMGPLERPDADSLEGPEGGAAPSGRGAASGQRVSVMDGGAGEGGGSLVSAPSASLSIASRAPANSIVGGGAQGRTIQTLEARVKRLETQLEASRDRLAQSENRLAGKKHEYDEMRDRLTGKDHAQFQEIKKLRQQVADLTAQMAEQKLEAKHKLEEAQRRFEEEQARLAKDSEVLRAQLATMTGSISSMMESRSSKASKEKRVKEAAVAEAERKVREQVLMTAEEKERQISNLKEQSTFFLARQKSEIGTLRAELEKQVAEREAEAEAMKAELDYVVSYAEKVTEVVRRMEAGVYNVTERGGLRQYKVPPRDRPAALDSERLRFLRSRSDAVDRMVATVAAAAVAPPTLGYSSMMGSVASTSAAPSIVGNMSLSGGADTSRVQSAHTAGSTAGLPHAAADVDTPGSSGLPPNLEMLKSQWEAELRGSITTQVVADLRSDKTVEYIRSLEGQVARYRQELQSEKRKNSEMTVALRSVQRVQSRPDSAINRVMNGGALTQPPAWGLGHQFGNSVHLAATATSRRPATAAAAYRSSPAQGRSVSASGNWSQRPGTALNGSLTGGF